jgi:penicillin-binding protein 1A
MSSSPPPPEPKPADPRRLPRRLFVWGKRLALAALVLAALAGAAFAFAVRHYEAGLPSTSELKSYDPPQVTRVLARDGTVLGELFTERRTLVGIETIPTQMKLAVLAAEDASFYEHAGLNYFGMLRALLVDLRGGRTRQGGSTITQQVVKNILLTPEKTLDRKAREMLLARRIEQELTKDEILELYLNRILFGHGRYGVEEASRYYFGKGIHEVTLAEAALLAGVIKGPGVYSPRVDLGRAKERRDLVLDQMVQKGFARAEQAEAAKKEPITLAPLPAEGSAESELAPEVVDEVKRTLRSLVGPAADRGGYTVTTTIDPALEAAARAAVRRNADDYEKRHKLLAPLTKSKHDPAPFAGTPSGHHAFLGVVTGADDARNTLEVRVGSATGTVDLKEAARYNPKALLASEFAEVGKVLRVSLVNSPPAHPREDVEEPAAPGAVEKNAPLRFRLELGPESALVAVDVRTREIVALVGSYEAVRAGLDRASFAHRQPGSTFKPFVYSYAIHARTMTPATIMETNPAALHGYKPDNYDENEGRTPKRLRDALALSVNVAAVWTLDKVGPENVVAWARALGIESKLEPTPSLALGAYEVTPREMVGAYATFAAGGVYEAPVLIRKITGPNGVAVPLPPRPPARRVMEEAEAYVVTSLLTSVVQEGTAKAGRALGRPIAGKTGTSNQAKDGWFVGFSTDLACAVWTGYDDPSPLGAHEAGATVALPAFVDFMREAHRKRAVTDFAVPPGVTRVGIDPDTGLRAYPDEAGAVQEVFLSGTEPTEVATPDAGTDGGGDDAGAALDAGASLPDASVLLPARGETPAPPPQDLPPPF